MEKVVVWGITLTRVRKMKKKEKKGEKIEEKEGMERAHIIHIKGPFI